MSGLVGPSCGRHSQEMILTVSRAVITSKSLGALYGNEV